MDVKGKTAIITGGGTGIGRAISLSLAELGANVVVNYSRSKDDAQDTVDEIIKRGSQGIIYQANVANDEEVVAMCQDVKNKFGSIDILVNNAGTTNFVKHDDLDGLTEEFWDNALNVNTKGTFFASRACAKALKESNGCIVNMASTAGVKGTGSSIAYAASKAAVISLTKSFARVLAPEVRVNAIAPGPVSTRWFGSNRPVDELDELGKKAPLGRVATPEDVAEIAINFITNSTLVTGQTLIIDGGSTI